MSDASAGLHHHAPRPLGEYRAIERYIQETELEDVIFSAHRDSLSVASTIPRAGGELQPWTLASSQAEGGPSHTERPTKYLVPSMGSPRGLSPSKNARS